MSCLAIFVSKLFVSSYHARQYFICTCDLMLSTFVMLGCISFAHGSLFQLISSLKVFFAYDCNFISQLISCESNSLVNTISAYTRIR